MSDHGIKSGLVDTARLGIPFPMIFALLVGLAASTGASIFYLEGRFGTIKETISQNRVAILAIQWCLEARRDNPKFVCPTRRTSWP